MKNQISHHPKFPEQFFFFVSGMLVSTPLPGFYRILFYYFKSTFSWNKMLIFLVVSTIFAPLFEEFAKAYPLFYRHGETERSLFKLGFLTGLGFGLIEFCLYVFFFHTPILDRLPLLFFHATNTSIVAYGISRNRAITFYILAVILHATNNFTASLGMPWYILGIIAVATSYILSFFLGRRVTDKIVGYWMGNPKPLVAVKN